MRRRRGLEKVNVRPYESIVNHMVCILLSVRILWLMESLIQSSGIALSQMLERLRLALQVIQYETRSDVKSAHMQTMVPTGFLQSDVVETTIGSGIQLGCET